jgi:alpha-tubulin suppressor-like RCC1 family protein
MGNGSWEDVVSPTPVDFPGTLMEVTSGLFHHCGLDGDGGAHCWGDNAEGELGNGMSGIGPIPFPVFGGHTYQQIRAGWRHTCGLATDGGVLCWGNNQYGQVGLGYSGDPETVPAEVIMPPGVTFTFVDLGYWHTCALSTEGEAWCWGRNNNGQLGDGTNSHRDLPVKVEGLPVLSEITVGGFHTCALDTSGEAYCWGRGTLGRLGTGMETGFNTPQLVVGGHTFRKLVGTAARTCGITTDDQALCWGHNVRGTLGIGREETPILEPTEVAGGLSFESFAAGFSDWHACGVTTGGAVYCWGRQRLSELGIGILGIEPTPVPVSGGAQFWRPQGIGMVR